MRQVRNEADGIADQKILVVFEMQSANRGVQRGKKHVLFKNLFVVVLSAGPEKTVHGRRFAGIRIADESDRSQTACVALFARDVLFFFDVLQLFFQDADAFADDAPVFFELGFTAAATVE